MTVRPADYPPPAAVDAVGPPTDPADERIEVGVAIVGAGPAGLACAIRFGQLLEGAPELAERLGEVPFAVLEKGKQPGSHLLSGAVINPRGLRRLFRGLPQADDFPSFGEVQGEAVYVLSKSNALRIPPPPTMRNHGNVVVSLSQLGRWLGDQAEEVGATILPETAATKLLVDHGAVRGVRTGDRGRGREGQELGNFEPGSDIVAKVTVLAEGTQGYLTGAAVEQFGLAGQNPQVYALGVKEVWKVARPLDRIVHTMGWPLRAAARYREFGGSWIYPLGEDMVSIGFVVGLDYRDLELSAHDLLQELKTHRLVRKILDGGERLEWGAKTIPEGGFLSLPRQLHAPGLLICGDGAGMVNVPALKGVHYSIESGQARRRSRLRRPAAGRDSDQGRGARELRRRGAAELHLVGSRGSAKPAAGVRQGLLRRRRAGLGDDGHEGPAPRRRTSDRAGRGTDAAQERTRGGVSGAGWAPHLRQALVGLPLWEQDPRRPAQPHPDRGAGAARHRRPLGEHVPCAGLRGRRRGRRRDGDREAGAVELRPVRRDHRKGRAPDPPEGGSGPEYQRT